MAHGCSLGATSGPPPRRFAVRPLDETDAPLLRPDLCGLIEVLLDGAIVPRCIAADTDAGFALAYQPDSAGGMRLVLGEPVLAKTHGRVEIRWKP
jgi:hypothetical protein